MPKDADWIELVLTQLTLECNLMIGHMCHVCDFFTPIYPIELIIKTITTVDYSKSPLAFPNLYYALIS